MFLGKWIISSALEYCEGRVCWPLTPRPVTGLSEARVDAHSRVPALQGVFDCCLGYLHIQVTSFAEGEIPATGAAVPMPAPESYASGIGNSYFDSKPVICTGWHLLPGTQLGLPSWSWNHQKAATLHTCLMTLVTELEQDTWPYLGQSSLTAWQLPKGVILREEGLSLADHNWVTPVLYC